MSKHPDAWYVRLPDGRVLRASSTEAVRHHVEAGRIPINSMVRRHADAEWTALSWAPEFSSLAVAVARAAVERAAPPPNDHPAPTAHGAHGPAPPPVPNEGEVHGVAARLDSLRLQTVGVRGLVEELLGALDSTLVSSKLKAACVAGVILLLGTFAVYRLVPLALDGAGWVAELLAILLQLLVLATVNTLLTRQTHLELSGMRRATLTEAREGSRPFVLRVFFAYLLVAGVALGLMVLFRNAPGWLAHHGTEAGISGEAVGPLANAAAAIGVLGCAVLWVIVGMCWLLAPVLVVEECSVGRGLREWCGLLRQHFWRVVLYEGLALAAGLVATLPLALPVALSLASGPVLPGNVAVRATVAGLNGLAVGPFLAFLAVANVFVYLNLRYEYSPAGK